MYLDLTADYSTEKFLMVLRRFVSLRGYPFKLYSDNGSQLVAANKELKSVTKGWDWEELKAFGNIEGFQWEFTTADAPWQNGVSEALVKSVKRAIAPAIHESILTLTFYKYITDVLCKKPLKNTRYSRNETFLKIGHLAKAIAHAKAIYSPYKMLSLGQKLKIPKTCEKPFYKIIRVVLSNKPL